MVVPLVGSRAFGSEVLVRYALRGPIEYHARFLGPPIGSDGANSDWYFVLTPDGDYYPENFGPNNPDIHSVRVRPADRSIPFGIIAAQVYDFAGLPTPAEVQHLLDEGTRQVPIEQARLGVAAPPPA